MIQADLQEKIRNYDKRRDLALPGDKEATVHYAVEHFITCANAAIRDHDMFCVALSGGSTPKAIFERLALPDNKKRVQWNKVKLFWGDERPVGPDHADSNYRMALSAGMGSLGIPPEQIFRMQAEENIQSNAACYEQVLRAQLFANAFDLVMLGMGDDGHTASLFPETTALKEDECLVIANHVPQQSSWRMTLSFPCINAARTIVLYVLGVNKAEILDRVLEGPYSPDLLPSQAIGTEEHKALWICDDDAAAKLLE